MYALPVAVQAPPSPHGSIYGLPQHVNASPAGNVMYITGSPAMTAGGLPPQSATGHVYVQQPQQYIQQQPQPQMHQATAQYMTYAQNGPSPLLAMMPLPQPSPQGVTCASIGDPIVYQGSNLTYLSTDQQLPAQLAPAQQYAVHPFLGQKSSEFWEVFRPVAPILNKMYTAVNLPATQPHQPEMRLVSADLPWTISIKAANGQFVTVGEVYEAIFSTLQGVVTHPEYRLTEVRTRKKMADQYQKRCTLYPLENNEHTRGIKRVDYLLHRNVFGGLKRDDKLAEELMMLNDQKMQYTWVLSFVAR